MERSRTQTVVAMLDKGSEAAGAWDVGGVSVAERAVRSAARAGAERVILVGRREAWGKSLDDDRFARGAEIVWCDTQGSELYGAGAIAAIAHELPERVVIIPAGQIVDPGVVRRAMASSGEVALVGPSGQLIASQIEARTASRWEPGVEIDEAIGAERLERELVDDERWARVETKASADQARDRLFGSLRKPMGLRSDGLAAYFVNRPISMAISRRLLLSRVTPNQITGANLALGIVAGVLMATGQVWLLAAGALLMQLVSILDGVDGELARMRVQMSKAGEWFDTLGDDVHRVATLAGLGIGAAQISAEWAGVYEAASGLGSAMIVVMLCALYAGIWRRGGQGAPNSTVWFFERPGFPKGLVPVARAVAYLLKRDTFTLILMPLAAFGMPGLAFWLMFAGVLVYFVSTFAPKIARLVRLARRRAAELDLELELGAASAGA